MSTNAAIFCELQMVKPHELLKADQIWVVESDWSVEIQLKVTCARPFSRCNLAPPTSGIARKGSSSTNEHDIKIFLQVVPGAQSQYHRPRPIPYAMRSRVVAELDQLEKESQSQLHILSGQHLLYLWLSMMVLFVFVVTSKLH